MLGMQNFSVCYLFESYHVFIIKMKKYITDTQSIILKIYVINLPIYLIKFPVISSTEAATGGVL